MFSRIWNLGYGTTPDNAPTQPKPNLGGLEKRDTTDEDIVAAANFALTQINGQQDSIQYTLSRISSAYSQVVAGEKYYLSLQLSAKPPIILEVGFDVVVFRDLDGKYQLVNQTYAKPPMTSVGMANPTNCIGVPGGKICRDASDSDIVDASKFAVTAMTQKLGSAVKLTQVLEAQSQVVAGVNYYLTLAVVINGHEDKVDVVVFHGLDQQNHLVFWRIQPHAKLLGGWEPLNPEYQPIVEASAKYVVHHLCVTTNVPYTYGGYSDVEQQVVAGMNFRYTLMAVMEGDIAKEYQVVVYWPPQPSTDSSAQTFHLVSLQEIV